MELSQIESVFRQGVSCLQTQRYAEALQRFDSVLAQLPHQIDASYFKSLALLRLERHAEVISCLQPALSKAPLTIPATRLADCHKALGSAWQATQAFDQAIDAFEQSQQLEPHSIDRRIDLVQCLLKAGLHERCDRELQCAEAIEPDHIRVISARAELAFQSWDVQSYLRHIQRAIRRQPNSIDLICQYLMALNYLPDDPQNPSAAAEHIAIGTALQARLPGKAGKPELAPPNNRDSAPSSALRIGFISPDLKRHSISYFLRPLLRGLQADPQVRTFCYATALHRDAVTDEIQSLATTFRQLHSSTDFSLIESDQLDILIDLAGHTNSKQFEALVRNRKLAPVYAHWMGYPNTTGFACFDFRLVDAITDPSSQSEPCSEQRLHLNPCFLCYGPPSEIPEVSPLPALRDDWITLASHNNLNKVTPGMLQIWATLLASELRFRLRIKSPLLTVHGVEDRIRAPFDQQGIAWERIELIPSFPTPQEALASYASVDVTLDPYPYNGTTTTFESLLMGCPVLTLAGKCHRSRVSASILSNLGLNDWITHDADAYLARALRIPHELDKLACLRQQLRTQLLESPLCDADGFARRFVDRLRSAGIGSP